MSVNAYCIEEEEGEARDNGSTIPAHLNNPLLQSPIHCVFVFRRPIMMSDRAIQLLAGPFTHMDLLVIMDKTPADSPSFTTYMGEPFHMSIRAKNEYNNKQYTGVYMDLLPDEAYSVFDYVMKLADHKVPYNFSDLLYQPIKGMLKDSPLFNDVHSDDPGQLQKVFCSQAFTLALRNSLRHGNKAKLGSDLRWQNSRLITPTDLYNYIRPYCSAVNLLQARHGHLVRM
eukprot:752302-Hanusia_phi.AAC.12